MKKVIITTLHRGVWCCKSEENNDLTGKTITNLKDCRMVIKWTGGKGFQDIAINGQSPNDLLSTASDIEVIHDVTGVFTITETAADKIWK